MTKHEAQAAGAALADSAPAQRPMPTAAQVEAIARVCHDANRAWQRENQEEVSPPWEEAPTEQRASAIEGVMMHLGREKFPRMRSAEEQSHNAWMERKLRDGWRYGTVKDFTAKTHPCLLPYESLPEWQRRKDALFRAICAALDPDRSV